jgi:hypothetical protein
MRIHRSAHQRYFTTLSNEVVRDSRLSFCARGILADLLSQPDGKRTDIRTLTAQTPEGRERVAAAMRELERFGYLRRTRRRTPEGRVYTELEVFETPDGPSRQVMPSAGFPAPGGLATTADGDHPVNDVDEVPTHPVRSAADCAESTDRREERQEEEEEKREEETIASAELLARVARTEPKLSLGCGEATRLAPLVSEWRRRGASELHIVGSLTAGLPREGVHHPARFIESRLRSKMPAERRVAPARHECDDCGVPILSQGLCRSCRGVEPAEVRTGTDFAKTRRHGAAMARAALRGLPFESALPLPRCGTVVPAPGAV